jgi:hypothetical protein
MDLPLWAIDERRSLLNEAKEYRHLSPEERGKLLAAACRSAARMLRSRPDRDLVLERRDPLPESSVRALEKLRRTSTHHKDRGDDRKEA